MAHRELKDRIYSQFARIAQALASDKRLELVDLLAQAPRHVDALAQETGMSVANVSQHLQVLRSANLVKSERRGNVVEYTLSDPVVVDLWLTVKRVAESLSAEVKQLSEEFLAGRENGHTVLRDQVAGSLKDGAILLDVRPAQEFAAGHLKSAINIPIEELHGRVEELPRDRRIITYCRGEYCLFADEAASLLRAKEYDVVRLEGGWPEWQSEGRPTQTLLTVLFTDIVDHTQMMSRLGDEKGRRLLREHERITRELLKRHGGVEVKTMGDGFMAAFGSVTKAVECSIELQQEFTQWNESAAGRDAQLSIRVGLNAGEPIEEDGDLFGASVIIAARIAAKACGGEILVSDLVRGLCAGKGFQFADRGEHEMRGFEEPTRVYEISWNCGANGSP
jgi:class 3 adenylate cyclase/DNA-binding transcriptional ArsR family regulator